jgi:hypothetical protein
MATGINLSIRDYRNILIDVMAPWMELGDLDLLEYFSLSGFSYTDKEESIIIDGFEYQKDEWTLKELKDDLGILGTGNYDDCTIDLIEEIDIDDKVYIYTNPNIIQIDAMAGILKKLDDRRNLLFTEMNPFLATVDGLLPFWEAIFQSQRLIINGVAETDSEYMIRAITELFGQSSALIVLRRVYAKYGLTNFYLENSKDDPFKWNVKSQAMSVNLHIEEKDFDRIYMLNNVWFNSSVAGMRLFILCPAQGHDCYCLNYGNASDEDFDYEVPPPFVPGAGIIGQGYGGSYGEIYGN